MLGTPQPSISAFSIIIIVTSFFIVEKSTLVQKISQLFVIGFAGAELTNNHPIIRDLQERGLGGVILFDRLLATRAGDNNIIDPDQVRQLTSILKRHGGERLLIAVDQEGGRVNRFKANRGFPQVPSAAELGVADDLDQTYQSARTTAAMLKSLGINWNLSPVVDLAINPNNPIIAKFGRSFGATPAQVGNHAQAWIAGHHDCGLLTCVKHFPGHGSSRSDSHFGFVEITGCWQEVELEPFAQLIKRKLVDAVMVGHLYHAALDPDYPASLSHQIITGILRQRLGFNGLVVADDLQMQAITDHYSFGEACCLAIKSGCDLLIIGNNLQHDPEILEKGLVAVSRGLDEGFITENELEASWRRVQTFKQQLGKSNATR
jgi:beta-N-acetylhexosaminidase